MEVFVAALTIFVLALFVGFEVITKVPPLLHTPLMSGSQRHFRHHAGGDLGHLGCPIDHLYHDLRFPGSGHGNGQRGGRISGHPPHAGKCFAGRTKYQECPQHLLTCFT